jgi:hypothetical protein
MKGQRVIPSVSFANAQPVHLHNVLKRSSIAQCVYGAIGFQGNVQ